MPTGMIAGKGKGKVFFYFLHTNNLFELSDILLTTFMSSFFLFTVSSNKKCNLHTLYFNQQYVSLDKFCPPDNIQWILCILLCYAHTAAAVCREISPLPHQRKKIL